MTEPQFEDCQPAFRVEVIETFDGFVLQKEGTSIRWGTDWGDHYCLDDWYEQRKFNKRVTVREFGRVEDAITKAKALEFESKRKVYWDLKNKYDDRQRKSFVERRVWR